MTTHLQLVRDDARPAPAQAADDPALRPTSFDTYVGQAEVIANLREAVSAARRGKWQLDHQLFAGPAGLGKTSLAGVIAAELGGKLRATSAPAIEHKGALASLLTTLDEGDVLFIDEIHALDRKVAEVLYAAMEDRVIDMPAGKRVIRVPLPKFTLLAATNAVGDGALIVYGDRTGRCGVISGQLAIDALARLGIDHRGLDSLDRRYLAVVAERPVGVEAICAELGEDRSTIENAVEPFLLASKLIQRGGKGRLATEAGRAHLAEVA
jgi:Holliday junction resolvasome RuvABC ATP-dependent DNA helicase subunit